MVVVAMSKPPSSVASSARILLFSLQYRIAVSSSQVHLLHVVFRAPGSLHPEAPLAPLGLLITCTVKVVLPSSGSSTQKRQGEECLKVLDPALATPLQLTSHWLQLTLTTFIPNCRGGDQEEERSCVPGYTGFPGGSVVKNLPDSTKEAGDSGSILGSGRPPGVGNGNPFHCSCLENSMDRGAWWTTQSMRLQRVRHDCAHTHRHT